MNTDLLPGRVVDHLSPPSARFKTEWIYTSTPPLYLLRVERCDFAFDVYVVSLKDGKIYCNFNI